MKPFEIHKQVVTAPSRKLTAKWTVEVDPYDERQYSPWELITTPYSVESISGEQITGEIYRRTISWVFDKNKDEGKYEFASIFDVLSGKYDIVPFRGINIEEEIVKALSASICNEIDNEIFKQLQSDILLDEQWIDSVEAKSDKIEIVDSLLLPNEKWINAT